MIMVEKILQFPRAVLSSNKSINEIVTCLACDYPYGLPPFGDLLAALRSDSQLVEDWFEYSENKRRTPSWFVLKHGVVFKVGHLGSDHSYNEGVFSDPSFACAIFIVLELDSLISELKRDKAV